MLRQRWRVDVEDGFKFLREGTYVSQRFCFGMKRERWVARTVSGWFDWQVGDWDKNLETRVDV